MVEYTFSSSLDNVFQALADPTRRDILQRVSLEQLTISQLAQKYNLTFSAVSKHLKVLENARLVIKRRKGKEQLVSLSPQALAEAAQYIEWYKRFTADRLDALENYLKEDQNGRY